MTFTASLDVNVATITLTGINSTSNLKIEGATSLGNQLIAFVTDPSTAPVDSTPHYQVYPTDTGLRITAIHGHIDLPWRWITPVSNALNA
jgi:hypothetical protein